LKEFLVTNFPLKNQWHYASQGKEVEMAMAITTEN
jgi:hypothetical protein